ncbi:MAG: hypothetical protein ACLQL2_05215 [Methylovirgula sp.]
MAHALVKVTQDGRKLEVNGLAITLDGKLEAVELMEVKMHPNRSAIVAVMPEATHIAGRVALTREEAQIILDTIKETEAEILANPIAIQERFRIAAIHRARTEGIE